MTNTTKKRISVFRLRLELKITMVDQNGRAHVTDGTRRQTEVTRREDGRMDLKNLPIDRYY